jgi:DNA polymerase-4
MKMAKERCPEAICIKGNTQTYTKFSRMVTEIVKEVSPVYEKTSIDEFYIDFTGMDRFFGIWTYASELRSRIIKETQDEMFGILREKLHGYLKELDAKNPDERIDERIEKFNQMGFWK